MWTQSLFSKALAWFNDANVRAASVTLEGGFGLVRSAFAVAKPMPLLPPVIRTCEPLKLNLLMRAMTESMMNKAAGVATAMVGKIIGEKIVLLRECHR